MPKNLKQEKARTKAEEDAALEAWLQNNISDSGLIEWYKAKVGNDAENWLDRFEKITEKEEQIEKPGPAKRVS